ncbi:MAG TPA: hypothetical protein VKN14_06545 [Flavobacteriaceae bacterium]|nr:hypothetical protein [Flavobacteriaceae bacterium]
MKRRILLLIIVLISFGCKTDSNEKKKQDEVEKETDLKKEFVVKMKFKTNRSDNIKMVLYNIISDEYQNKYIVINESIVLTSEMDMLTANFGENISDNFRINFGEKEIKEIEIESIELSFDKNTLLIEPSEIINYFDFNEYIVQDPISYKLQTKRIEEKLHPIIYLKPQYMRELQN